MDVGSSLARGPCRQSLSSPLSRTSVSSVPWSKRSVTGTIRIKKPLGPDPDMRGSALAQVRVCALAKYDNSGHAPTVRHRMLQCQPDVRAISGFGRIVQETDKFHGLANNAVTAWLPLDPYRLEVPPGVKGTPQADGGRAGQRRTMSLRHKSTVVSATPRGGSTSTPSSVKASW